MNARRFNCSNSLAKCLPHRGIARNGAVRHLSLPKPRTWLWTWLCHYTGGLGVTVGVHRLWSHRSFKATWPLRLALMIFNCIAAQNDIFEWARDHRVHHKYSETDADPHNATRGFFFSHVGWLMVRKHPDVIKKGKQIDLSDLYEDKIVMFQRRYLCNRI